MKPLIIATFLSTCLLTSSVSGLQKRYWTTFYIKEKIDTTANVVVRCTVPLDQEQMESYLRKVGWPKNANPSINWEEDIPVIIAPGETHTGYPLVFIDLNWTGKEFILSWGWWNPALKQYWGSSTFSAGFEGTPRAEILIVVVKRYVYTANKLSCQEYDSARPR
jgi:hypothetical protein